LREIDREDARASQIIQQRAMLQKRDPQFRRLDLNEVMRESVAIVAHETHSRVRIDLQLSDTPCVVSGDQILLQQVITNLLVNAMDSMAQMPDAERSVLITTTLTRHVAEVSVQDRGQGIANTVIARVFEPFVTTKGDGMGIGLAIVRGIIEAHRGRIQATNNPDGGATFWFTVQALDSDLGEQSTVDAPPTARAAS
jgi:signal transduction histidine kinase